VAKILSLSESWGLCERRKGKGEEDEDEVAAGAAMGGTAAAEKDEVQDGERRFVVLLAGLAVVAKSDQPKGRKCSSSGKVLTLFRATASDAGFVE
jgi:hypothetical protein